MYGFLLALPKLAFTSATDIDVCLSQYQCYFVRPTYHQVKSCISIASTFSQNKLYSSGSYDVKRTKDKTSQVCTM